MEVSYWTMQQQLITVTAVIKTLTFFRCFTLIALKQPKSIIFWPLPVQNNAYHSLWLVRVSFPWIELGASLGILVLTLMSISIPQFPRKTPILYSGIRSNEIDFTGFALGQAPKEKFKLNQCTSVCCSELQLNRLTIFFGKWNTLEVVTYFK